MTTTGTGGHNSDCERYSRRREKVGGGEKKEEQEQVQEQEQEKKSKKKKKNINMNMKNNKRTRTRRQVKGQRGTCLEVASGEGEDPGRKGGIPGEDAAAAQS